MSSQVTGRFQDHYDVLGIAPGSDSDAIQAAYTVQVEKYHPSNMNTGDPERLESVNLAFEVLSDPVLRKTFDQLKGVDKEKGDPKFTGAKFFDLLGRQIGLRSALLCILYDRRRASPFKPSLSMRNVESMIAATTEELNFTLWYLKHRGLVVSDDKSALQISVDGLDYLEKERPTAEVVMTFIKPSALAGEETQAAAPAKSSFTARMSGFLKTPATE